MDRCIVLVDAGYLLGAAASLLAGEPSRSRITVDHSALIQGLRDRAESDTQQPLLRIYWFDGAPDRVPQPEHRRLRVMPRVTVRLGALTRSDGRWAQKGVDAAMHAELTELARNRACSDVVLVTGDGDLLPGMMAAKEHGVAVHLWAVQAADGDYNQSEDLVAEADERRVLDRTWITKAVRAKELGGICAPPPVPRPEIAAILSAPLPESALSAAQRPAEAPEHPTTAAAGPTGTEERVPPAKGVPTPKDLAALRAPGAHPAPQPTNATLRWSSDKGWVDRPAAEPAEAATLPTLAQLTTAEQRWADREEDITTVGGDPYEVGQV
ncbi:NYN domain-containing protein, partial [Streptomyces sp. SID5926]|nr:NYN domain-containing protein [Streptomyces sp. SID5926]